MKIKNEFSGNLPSSLVAIIEPYAIAEDLSTEADFYGASLQIAKKLGLKTLPRPLSSWSHGCHTAPLKYKEQIIWGDTPVKHTLVGNAHIRDFLSAAGVDSVEAVGLPILYVDGLGITRRERSILFMPAHSLGYFDLEHQTEPLLEQAIRLGQQGHYVCFCLHRDCVKQGKFIEELDRHGIDWFTGSAANDMNSLQRMRNVFEYFETVASNVIGSHFYYAQLFGAKFYFTAPYFEYKLEANANSPHWRDKKHILAHDLNGLSESSIRQRFPDYFQGYENAVCDTEMARKICGADSKVEVHSLAKMLGWGIWDQAFYHLKLLGGRIIRKSESSYMRTRNLFTRTIKRIMLFLGFELVRVNSPVNSGENFSPDIPLQLINTYKKVQSYTMTSPERIFSLCDAVKYIHDSGINGDVVECGVWKGGSMMAIAETLGNLSDTSRSLYLFDTFDGMAPPSKNDVDINGKAAEELLNKSEKTQDDSVWCCAGLEVVKQALDSVNYPNEKIHYIQGMVEQTIPMHAPEKIALLRLDTDWYESTKHEMEHLFPRLVKGGVLIIDDYGHWQGARKAVDEYLHRHQVKIFLNRIDYTGRIAVKID